MRPARATATLFQGSSIGAEPVRKAAMEDARSAAAFFEVEFDPSMRVLHLHFLLGDVLKSFPGELLESEKPREYTRCGLTLGLLFVEQCMFW